MKIDAEMITYITSNFSDEVCNALIKEWENDCSKEEEKSVQIFNKKEAFYLDNASSDYRNNQERNNRTTDGRHKNPPARKDRQRSRSRSRKNETHDARKTTTGESKPHEQRHEQHNAETSNQESQPHRPNRESHDHNKNNRRNQHKFETIKITTRGDHRNVSVERASSNNDLIIPETQLSENEEEENLSVSRQANNFLFHSQGATHGQDFQN